MSAPARYGKVGTGGATQPPPGGCGLSALSATLIRIAFSKIDADAVAHLDLLPELVPGYVLVITSSTNVTWNCVLPTTPVPIENDYWWNVWADVADAAGLAAITGDMTLLLPAVTDAWVTGSEILAHVRVTAPTSLDTSWANACAGAVNAGINAYLGTAAADPSPEMAAEISANALTAGGDAYRRRDAPFGLSSYSDISGVATRVARDYLEGIRPQLERWRTVADGIA